MRTSDLAKLFAVHPNTVRLYEEWGYLPPIPRNSYGQREFNERHVAQMRLARCVLHDAPPSNPQFKERCKDLVWLACAGQLPLAITQARKHLSLIRLVYEHSQTALEFLQGVVPERIAHLALPLRIHQAAAFVGISVPLLRRWELYGFIHIPRSAKNNYRIYGTHEIGWLLVIHCLRQAGYKVSACEKLITQHHEAMTTPETPSNLCDVIAECLGLFTEHEGHTNRILDQLNQMQGCI